MQPAVLDKKLHCPFTDWRLGGLVTVSLYMHDIQGQGEFRFRHGLFNL